MIERLTFSASVEVRSAPAEVFALVSDLRRKARLKPNIQVIRVEPEGDGPVREGSVFYHRFQKGTRIFEYRSRCVRFAPPHLFEARGETDPPFGVRVMIVGGGLDGPLRGLPKKRLRRQSRRSNSGYSDALLEAREANDSSPERNAVVHDQGKH